jgi:capsid protein
MSKNQYSTDQYGNVIAPQRRDEVTEWQQRYAKLKATYDAARTTDEFRNYWANADRLDADSANSREVRHTLVSRSRYEVANNAFADGIAQTITNDLIGIGPSLRMQTGSEGFNRMIEMEWWLWCKAVHLPRKLWTLAHAKHVDGEGFGIVAMNRNVRHAIQLDVVLREAEQCQTPYPPINDPRYVDGIKLNEAGDPAYYEFLSEHPGATNRIASYFNTTLVPADSVLHWFRLRRPGQHRGIPEMCSSLNAGAAGRRWREATLSAAERAALLTLMMKTQMTPEDADAVAPFSTMDIEKGLMSFLPMGWDPFQADAVFPSATHESFNKALINEQGRSVNMPRNKAAADSSDYNYASGRLDHGTYYDSLDVQRGECDELVMDKLFRVWFNLAVSRFGWLGGDPFAISEAARVHLWDWPKHRVADVEAEANANQTKLKSGQVSIVKLKSEAGIDAEDDAIEEAAYYGITVDELKRRQMDVIYPPVQQGGAPNPATSPDDVDASLRAASRRHASTRMKSNGHANGGHVNGN